MNKPEGFGRVSGFIDQDTELKGDIRFKESFRIDGHFVGKILSGQVLIIGEGGYVEGDIEVSSVSINGRVQGSISAREKIEIFSKGRVCGKITTPKLVVEEGAFFQGSCQMEMKSLKASQSGGDVPAKNS